MKNKKNMGFSLVELIVVVAIMAVLIGVLAPAYLSYVEKTRKGNDENTAEELRHAIEIACADIDVYDEVKGGVTLTYSDGSALAQGGTELTAALTEVFSTKTFEITSKEYNGKSYVVTITAGATSTSALSVTGAWGNAAAATPTQGAAGGN